MFPRINCTEHGWCQDCSIFTPSAWLWRNTPEPPTTERGSAVLSRRVGSLSSLVVRMGWPTCGIQTQVRVKTGLWEHFVLWRKLCTSLLCRWCSRGLLRALLSHCPPWRVFPPPWKHGCLLCLWTAPTYPHIPVRSQRFVQKSVGLIFPRETWLFHQPCSITASQLEARGIKAASATDCGTVRNTSGNATLLDTSAASALDQFAQTTRLALKTKSIKEQLDSVLVIIHPLAVLLTGCIICYMSYTMRLLICHWF